MPTVQEYAAKFTGDTSDFESAVGRIDGSFGGLAGSAAKAGVALAALGGAAVIGGLAAGVKSAGDLQQAVANISTIKPEIDTSGVFSALNEMSTRVPQTASELGDGLYNIFSSIETTQAGALTLLENFSQSAVGAGTDVETFGTAALGVMNAYGLSVEDAGHISDVFFNTVNKGVVTGQELAASLGPVTQSAKAAGVGLDELGGFIAGVTKEGGPAAQNINNLNNFLQKITTKEAQKELTGLGVATKTATGEFRPTTEVLTDLKAKLGGMTEAARANALQAIFPDAQARIGAQTLLSQLDFVKEAIEDNKTSAGSAASAFTKMNETFNSQVKILGNTFQSLLTTVGAEILPAITPVLVTFSKNLPGAFAATREALTPMVASVGQGFRDMSTPVYAAGQDISKWSEGVKTGSANADTAIKGAGSSIGSALVGIAAAFRTDGSGAMDAFGASAKTLSDTTIPALTRVMGDLKTAIATPGTGWNDMATAMSNVQKVAESMSGPVKDAGDASEDTRIKIERWQAVGGFIAGVAKTASAELVGLVERFKIAGEIMAGLGTAMSKTFEAVGAAASGDFARAGQLMVEVDVALGKVAVASITAGERVDAAIRNAMLPALALVPISSAAMAAAMDRDAEEMARGTDANLGVKIPQTVEAMAAAVELDMQSLSTGAQTNMTTFTGAVTTGSEEARLAAETGAIATVAGVDTQLATLPDVAEPSLGAYVATVTTQGELAALAGTDAAQALVTDSGMKLAEMPGVAEASLAPVAGAATDAGASAASAFDTELAVMPASTKTRMGGVLDVVAAQAGPAQATATPVGTGIAEGVLAGVEGLRTRLGTVLGGIVRGGLDVAKSALGISSPSTVAATEVGVPLAEGIIQGMVDRFASGDSRIAEGIKAIVVTALKVGIDPIVALALGKAESGLNPAGPPGDSGHSVGLFQLHDQGQGAGMTVAQRQDPWANAEKFLGDKKALFDQLSGQYQGADLAKIFGGKAEVSDPQYWERYAQAYREIVATLGPLKTVAMGAGSGVQELSAAFKQVDPEAERLAQMQGRLNVVVGQAFPEATDLGATHLRGFGIAAQGLVDDMLAGNITLDQAKNLIVMYGASTNLAQDPLMRMNQGLTDQAGALQGVLFAAAQVNPAYTETAMALKSGAITADEAALNFLQLSASTKGVTDAVVPADQALRTMAGFMPQVAELAVKGGLAGDDLTRALIGLSQASGFTKTSLDLQSASTGELNGELVRIVDEMAIVDPRFAALNDRIKAEGGITDETRGQLVNLLGTIGTTPGVVNPAIEAHADLGTSAKTAQATSAGAWEGILKTIASTTASIDNTVKILAAHVIGYLEGIDAKDVNIDVNYKDLTKATEEAKKLKAALDKLDSNTSKASKDAFEAAKGKGINTTTNVDPQYNAAGGWVHAAAGLSGLSPVVTGELGRELEWLPNNTMVTPHWKTALIEDNLAYGSGRDGRGGGEAPIIINIHGDIYDGDQFRERTIRALRDYRRQGGNV